MKGNIAYQQILQIIAAAQNVNSDLQGPVPFSLTPCSSSGWSSKRYIIKKQQNNTSQEKYFCKCYTISGKNDMSLQENLRNEFTGLHFAHECFRNNSSNYYAPRPLALFEHEKTILMDYANGKNLLSMLNGELGKFSLKNISNHLVSLQVKAGEMLRTFQRCPGVADATEAQQEEANTEIFKTGLQAIFELTGTGISLSILDAYKEHITKIHNEFHLTKSQLLQVHWDFRPQNILVEENTDRLGLVDFQLFSQRGNPYRDPATYLLSLFSFALTYSKTSNIERLISGFLSGYLGDSKPFHHFSAETLDHIIQVRLPWQINSLLNNTSITPYKYIRNKIICYYGGKILKKVLSSGGRFLDKYYSL